MNLIRIKKCSIRRNVRCDDKITNDNQLGIQMSRTVNEYFRINPRSAAVPVMSPYME